MNEFIINIITILIIALIFIIPISIIIWTIVHSIKKSDNNDSNSYPPMQNYQKIQKTSPQNTYKYLPQNNYIPPTNRYITPKNSYQLPVNRNYPYQATSLLTEREYSFFRVLKVIANRNNMNVLIKVRLADLIKVSDSVPKNEFYKYFNKISAKHIDFILIDGTKVVALIELDDSTHKRRDRIERDNFINETVTKCGYRIIHTYGNTKQIEDEIIQYRKTVSC